MSKKTNKINSYPFESADAVVGRIESFMAARYIYDDGKVPKNDLVVEYLSGLHLELTKAPSINSSILRRLTREFHASKNTGATYLNMLPAGMREHAKSGGQMMKMAFSRKKQASLIHNLWCIPRLIIKVTALL
ncbi:MAG: hypothetical protein COB14_06685 [Alphaproteobacteria bacterium]|nr:MAG: hypothetical protein COB14_06685 [Alphaproteobacteria bacterium]